MVGLGNPGPAYHDTRHNAGFRVVDALAARLGARFHRPCFRRLLHARAAWRGSRLRLVKPLTYMNRSGEVFPGLLRAARRAARSSGAQAEVLVVCDTLDLPPGSCRLRRRGSPSGRGGGHKGLSSIIHFTGGGDFMRLYVGIGRPAHPGEVVDYVLGSPSGAEAALIAEAEGRAAEAVLRLTAEGAERVMNDLNRHTGG